MNEIEKNKIRVAICQGKTKDYLNGRLLPGDWNDGTDGACDGWWRGQDNGIRGAVARVRRALSGEINPGICNDSGLQEVCLEIEELIESLKIVEEENICMSQHKNFYD